MPSNTPATGKTTSSGMIPDDDPYDRSREKDPMSFKEDTDDSDHWAPENDHHGKRSSGSTMSNDNKRAKIMSLQLDAVLESLNTMNIAAPSLVTISDAISVLNTMNIAAPSRVTISDAISVLNTIDEVPRQSPMYYFATKIFKNKEQRETFVALLPEDRVWFLEMEQETFGASAPKSQSEGLAPSSSTGNFHGIPNGSGFTSSTQSIPIQFGATFGSSSSTASLFSSGTVFGSNSTAPSTMSNPISSSSNTGSTLFGSNWKAPKSPVSGSPFSPTMFGSAPAITSSTVAMFGSSTIGASSSSPSTGFFFGASSASPCARSTPAMFGSAPASTVSTVAMFGSSTIGASSSSPSTGFFFGASSTSSCARSTPAMFGSAPASTVSTVAMFGSSTLGASSSSVFSSSSTAPAAASSQPVFGNAINNSLFSLSSGPAGNNNDQMSMEDSMATVQAAAVSVFGQQPIPSPSSFMFGSTPSANPSVPFGSAAPPCANPFGLAAAPFGANPFQFRGQQNPNPSPFQASGSLEFNAGGTGSFSLGSGCGNKSGRKIVKVNRSKHRKK